MKSSQFVDALTNDIDGTNTGSSAILEALTAKKNAAAKTGSDDEAAKDGDGSGDTKAEAAATAPPKTAASAATSAFDEMQEKLRADLATLVE